MARQKLTETGLSRPPITALREKQHICSFDHLVGAHEKRWWHVEPDHLRCFEIDNRFVLGRCLHWKFGGLVSAQNAVDLVRRLAKHFDLVGPIGHQTARRDKETKWVDRG
jgi:hypothetical protein